MASIKECEALVAERRRLLEEAQALLSERQGQLREAQAALEEARNRLPVVGDFVRSTLTNFFGRVTKVVPRPQGRPWVEITPYLAPGLPGHSTMDLYDAWEIIDDPAVAAAPETEATAADIVEKLTEVIVSYDFIAPRARRA